MSKPFTITGKVSVGSQRGRSLGFPTANLAVSAEGYEDGVYLAYTYWQEKRFASLLFIGSAITFNETARKVEVYLLAGASDWYGRQVRVAALNKLRDNVKFDSAAELVEQMKRDEIATREYFKLHSE